jgi:hypothetical protein
MYERSGDEEIIGIEPPLPEADPGAPSPHLWANDETLLAYWTSVRFGGLHPPVALVQFRVTFAVYVGSPNDEALNGHPLFEAGLTSYEFVEVKNSPWVSALERRNRVHPDHKPERYANLRHFILPFHDETFECIAHGVSSEVVSSDNPTLALLEGLHRRST